MFIHFIKKKNYFNFFKEEYSKNIIIHFFNYTYLVNTNTSLKKKNLFVKNKKRIWNSFINFYTYGEKKKKILK